MRGDDVPLEYQRILFPPERREYELVYSGKEREADILADTMAVPLQPVRTFGASTDPSDWRNLLIFGDNLQAMKTLLSMKKRGELKNTDGTDGVRLVYIDPPFSTKQEFRGSQEQKAYQDKIAGARFLEFTRQRLIMIRELLSEDGSVYVHLDTKKGHYIKVLMDEIFGESRFDAEIVWKRADSHNDSTSFGTVHDCIFFYSKNKEFTFNSQRVPISEKTADSWYRHIEPITERRYNLGNLVSPHPRPNLTYEFNGIQPPKNGWRYTRERMQEFHDKGLLVIVGKSRPTLKIKQYLDESKGKLVTDWWDDISQLRGYTSTNEAYGYPTQKPETLLERVILTSSNEGDIVLDAFAGSGTTPAVSEKLGRRWVAIDSGKLAVYTIQKRMLSLKNEIGNKGKTLIPKPFDLCNAGLYDFTSLRTLPWKDWRFFALALFECRDEPHGIKGLRLDGKRRGASVLVFNHLERPGQRIDEGFVQSIHEIVGHDVGNEFCIVAPKAVFDFQQDYLELDGVRYYALRIPYSFISELHRRSFSALKQPSSEADVNGLVDSYGFDFIVRPTFSIKAGVVAHGTGLFTEAYIQITQFQSHAKIRGEDEQGGMESLSMLMLDFDYDGEVFDFDAVFYAHQLANTDWTARFPEENIGNKMMAVLIDIHGNEAQEVISREQFQLTNKDH
ncbi:MAG: site-specific DNA-methyltransferase [Armatimonas sp.]